MESAIKEIMEWEQDLVAEDGILTEVDPELL